MDSSLKTKFRLPNLVACRAELISELMKELKNIGEDSLSLSIKNKIRDSGIELKATGWLSLGQVLAIDEILEESRFDLRLQEKTGRGSCTNPTGRKSQILEIVRPLGIRSVVSFFPNFLSLFNRILEIRKIESTSERSIQFEISYRQNVLGSPDYLTLKPQLDKLFDRFVADIVGNLNGVGEIFNADLNLKVLERNNSKSTAAVIQMGPLPRASEKKLKFAVLAGLILSPLAFFVLGHPVMALLAAVCNASAFYAWRTALQRHENPILKRILAEMESRDKLKLTLDRQTSKRRTLEKVLDEIALKELQLYHDIQTPLSVIQLSGRSMKQRQEVQLISLAAKRIKNMADELREQASTRRAQHVQMDVVKSLIKEVVHSHRVLIVENENVRIEYSLKGSEGLVKISPTELYRILSNLLKNALDSGAVGVIHLDLRIDKNYLLLDVCDSGPGFGKSSKHGMGLGLLHAQRRVSEWGGHLSVSSTAENKTGTRVSIALPFYRDLVEMSWEEDQGEEVSVC
jgi:signal transduction histidine kinase